MSIKDRIKFFQNLKSSEEPKPPKPLPTKIVNNQQTENRKSVTIATQSIQQLPKPQIKPPLQTLEQQKPISPIRQPPKSVEIITRPTTNVTQSPLTQTNHSNKNPQKSDQEEPRVLSVKQRLKLLEQKGSPIVQQQPVIKSYFIPTKQSPFERQSQPPKDNLDIKPPQKKTSMPEKTQIIQTQKRLSFQQMRLLAQGLLSRTQAPPPKRHENQQKQLEDSQENQLSSEQIHEGNSHQIKVQLDQQTEKLEEEGYKKQQKESVVKGDTESEILFKQALLQQSEHTLVTGQSANLNLGVRKTMNRRRNNDDFDDL